MQTRLFSMLGIAAFTLAAATAAPAATRAETTTYVDGNLTGVSPNTGGTLLLSDDKAMYFRTGLSNVPVPYASISHTELGAVKETSHDVPLYKVWALRKRFAPKTETQLLIVNFKNDEGEEKNMTLELPRASAPEILSAIRSHSGNLVASEKTTDASPEPDAKPAKHLRAARADSKKDSKQEPEKTAAVKTGKSADSWWGDDYWKTTRNTDKWNSKASGSGTNDQR